MRSSMLARCFGKQPIPLQNNPQDAALNFRFSSLADSAMSWGRRFDDFETCRLKALKVVRQVSAELPPLSSSKLAGSKGRTPELARPTAFRRLPSLSCQFRGLNDPQQALAPDRSDGEVPSQERDGKAG